MSKSSPVQLVIGADGLLGGALLRRLRMAGESVAGTTRRRANVSEQCLYLDLTDTACEWRAPWPVSVAYVCAGVNKLQVCKGDPEGTAKVNVEGVCSLAAGLAAAGAFVVLLSSNHVLDGSAPRRAPDAPLSPLTEYGRQKAEVERRMAACGASVAIVRFAKILGPGPSLFTGWADSLARGEAIHPFSDMSLAPVPLSFAVEALTRTATLRLSGVTQVSAAEELSYAEAALAGARALNADPGLVQPVAAAKLGAYKEAIPPHTTLNIDRLGSALGLVPPAVRWTVETAFVNSQLLGDV